MKKKEGKGSNCNADVKRPGAISIGVAITTLSHVPRKILEDLCLCLREMLLTIKTFPLPVLHHREEITPSETLTKNLASISSSFYDFSTLATYRKPYLADRFLNPEFRREAARPSPKLGFRNQRNEICESLG